MKKILLITGIIEILTGLILLIAPQLLGTLLFGVAISGVVILIARIAGIALFSFGITYLCDKKFLGMLIYNVLITGYLAYVGYSGGFTGVLLWPIVFLHLILSMILIYQAKASLYGRQ
ncbi:hypothetical protein [Candidatus Berkiella aquae]|uniref:Uncharacterized protein n=1 Tax=Candidatus Berkiella aquae TaxID=295108 RepID=A0A0Q9YIG4_9GAMM|nr:hypothetical protein [Candidatus Berkiella aquae]MCS5711730.1 hypothetical protein [Candidatus Berkiella aquae]